MENFGFYSLFYIVREIPHFGKFLGEDDSINGPHYVPHPFKDEPGWGVSSVNYDLNALLEHSTKL